MRKIGELKPLNYHGTIEIFYDEKAKYDPFRVYLKYFDFKEDGRLAKRKRMLAKYGNLGSCVCYMQQFLKRIYN